MVEALLPYLWTTVVLVPSILTLLSWTTRALSMSITIQLLSVSNHGGVSHGLSDDALAQALMDPRYPTERLGNYDEWTIDSSKLKMGPAFAQGAFGKLYRGTYNDEDVAIKLLEWPENDVEITHLMEQQFQQEGCCQS